MVLARTDGATSSVCSFLLVVAILTLSLGYINIDEAQAGSPNEEYWGCIDEGDLILDKDGNKIGELEPGKAWVCVININTWLISQSPLHKKRLRMCMKTPSLNWIIRANARDTIALSLGSSKDSLTGTLVSWPLSNINLTPLLQGHENCGALPDHYRSQHVCYLGRCLILSLYLHSVFQKERE